VKYFVTVNGQELEVTLDASEVHVGDAKMAAHVVEIEGTPLQIVTIGDRVHRVLARRGNAAGQYAIHLDGFRLDVEALDERTRAIRQLAATAVAKAGPAPLLAPMPGLVVRVLAQPGDHVAVGQGLVVMEAMKMENELRASGPGIVKLVHVAAGDAVEKGAILVELE
jgi:biotin carboxyl carrier protein